MPTETTLVLAHAASTWFMTGLIWYAQIVHYPVFSLVDPKDFPRYQVANTTRTAFVVLPPMLVELVSGIALVFFPSEAIGRALPLAGAALLGVIWVSTAALQAPLHGRLALGFDRRIHRTIVVTNWFRTVAWTLRGALASAMLARIVT